MNRLRIPAIVVAAASLAAGAWFFWASFIEMPNVSVSDVRQGETLVLGIVRPQLCRLQVISGNFL
jgi:hypothetical protein